MSDFGDVPSAGTLRSERGLQPSALAGSRTLGGSVFKDRLDSGLEEHAAAPEGSQLLCTIWWLIDPIIIYLFLYLMQSNPWQREFCKCIYACESEDKFPIEWIIKRSILFHSFRKKWTKYKIMCLVTKCISVFIMEVPPANLVRACFNLI